MIRQTKGDAIYETTYLGNHFSICCFRPDFPGFISWSIRFCLWQQASCICFFPSYTRQIMNGSLNPALICTVIAVVSGQACITSVSQFILAAASAKVSLRLRELIWRQILRLPVPF